MSATREEFERLRITVGVITDVEDFPEARVPAYKLTIDFGPQIGTKRSSAQLTHYAKQYVLGRQVVCVLGFERSGDRGVPFRGARARRIQRRARRGAAGARPRRRAGLGDRLRVGRVARSATRPPPH